MQELLLQALYSGVLVGGIYALIGLGLALAFGTMRVINLAHGELVLLAAYVAYTMESAYGLNPLLSLPVAAIVTAAASATVYFLVSRIRRNRELNSLMLTFALGVILTNGILLIWKSDIRSTSTSFMQDAVQFGSVYSMNSELGAFVVSVFVAIALWYWLSRSWYGRAVRAVSSNRDAAKLMGINPAKVEVVSFLVAGLLAAVAGTAIYSSGVISPPLGHALTVKAFIITVLAGVGSVPGVLLAALLLGVAEALTVTFFSSALQELSGMVLFLVVLFVLPNGLFGGQKRRG
ncbi:MAG: branched-chain amino acid ABC transporter permease [Betaproteobacteria bacterium HGW-Betaproteobacteria-13]|jgi:branched-chain amino acid transport system permease protein|uniref:Branched-chain amino acid ABC transporter permease n=1 Tax=Parazoarcus communis TaxID=41977 RepID=A0A2U8GY50_9RHOO|nr:branched-chain amino acid ABC transporter permease [Parazoarcus communis]AWI77906.1 branched-chain amino acid ABC transporter permease [Parazoarcus communis]PKO82523.1 MAG: branched-chain amino acid ABC transporter permease [Betaproteobacteria bacterium HGW-Betaproteobacteria-13]PLX73927.1 MAG: branched-chain amino acid ABC transporter permease [Azoarcus sp.]TVT56567.1 MAG: branched-chain amino acid ABC transporter permease [Azoarcus sp. PHD]|tara:strand:- start:14039 stop:14911 length:873 start_codon:yes stop_codon:yes gene_type:complete